MTEEAIASSLNLLRVVRADTDAIGVAVSFGKDSLVTLDLCSRVFKRIEAYYLYRVRGLEIVDGWAKMVRQRWGVQVRMYPHFDLVRCYRNAVLQPHWNGLEKIPRVGLAEIEAHFRSQADVSWLAMGWRRNDSFSRALIMKQCAGLDPKSQRVFPLRAWRRKDVLAYLAQRRIPIPPDLGRKEQAGLDFHPAALAELRDRHPADWARWCRDFPFSGLQLVGRDADVEGAQVPAHVK